MNIAVIFAGGQETASASTLCAYAVLNHRQK